MSSGAQNLLTLAQGWNRVEDDVEKISLQIAKSAGRGRRTSLDDEGEAPDPDAVASRVSSSAADFVFSISAGFTQSETSTAWCGSNVVVGFNDSGSFFESMLFGPGGASFSGASFSSSPAGLFHDMGYINPGPDPSNFLAGDPVVTCTKPTDGVSAGLTTFYYSQIFLTGPPAKPVAAIAVSKSLDGGATWGDPAAATQKDGITHFLDKPWSATDPSDPQNIFVSYTDFDSSGAVCGFAASGVAITRTAIEIVRSADGGLTWSSPLVISEACSTGPAFGSVQGSQIAIDSAGTVYVAWRSMAGVTGTIRALWVRRSTNHGENFSPLLKIDNVIETGDGVTLQANFRINEFPMLAIDRNSGMLYVAWNDGRNFSLTDLGAPDGAYHYADILLSRSTNGGVTWSPALRVNADPLTHLVGTTSRGTDHYMPGIAVDKTGAVGVCWYDRRSDPLNLASGRFCSISTDGGNSWLSNFFVNGNWAPWHGTDAFMHPFYFGDYDALASDFTLASPGFVGAYGVVNTNALVPNQDVGFISFP